MIRPYGAGMELIVDGNNVMGAVPDGWWRDRKGAVLRLVARLQCYAAASGPPITLVLDVPQDDLEEGDHEGVVVLYATRRGRDAADDRIVDLLAGVPGTGEPLAGIEVVTSDRALAERVRERGATVLGAKAFLQRVSDAGC